MAAADDTVIWPYFTHLSTRTLMRHFDDEFYDVSPKSHLYKLVDVLVGEAGAGDLVRQSLITRAQADIQGIWFGDLDALFGNLLGFPRLLHETYRFDPRSDQLTQAQFDEAMVKDAWYRARVADILQGLQAGGTVEGMRLLSRAVTGTEADIYESWRFKARYPEFGRLPQAQDREIIIVPNDPDFTERERKILLHLSDRLKPADSFVTLSPGGAPAFSRLEPRRAAADSSYFELRKHVTNAVDMSKIPPPEYVAEDLHAGQKWLYDTQQGETVEAPTTPFATGQEFSLYYGLSATQIVGVDYLSWYGDAFTDETNHVEDATADVYAPWEPFSRADSPDNYPGGRDGLTPMEAPAVTADGADYEFPWPSQDAYEQALAESIRAEGGQVDGHRYRRLLRRGGTSTTFFPADSVSSSPPHVGELSVSWFSDRGS